MKKERIGLTGSMGSGKSTVAERLRTLGAYVLDADKAAGRLLEERTCVDAIVKRFGRSVLSEEDARIDRSTLAKVVFSDDCARRDLNAIMHPAVFAALEAEYSFIRRSDAVRPVFFDVPLLFETGYETKMDRVIVVCSDSELCIRRVMVRSSLSEEQIRSRLAAQMDQEEKLKRADYVIRNNGTLEELFQKVDRLYRSILNDA